MSIFPQFSWLPSVHCYCRNADGFGESWFDIQRENDLIKLMIQCMVIAMPLSLHFRKLIKLILGNGSNGQRLGNLYLVARHDDDDDDFWLYFLLWAALASD